MRTSRPFLDEFLRSALSASRGGCESIGFRRFRSSAPGGLEFLNNTSSWREFEEALETQPVSRTPELEWFLASKDFPWSVEDVAIFGGSPTRDVYRLRDLSLGECDEISLKLERVCATLSKFGGRPVQLTYAHNYEDAGTPGHQSVKRLHFHIRRLEHNLDDRPSGSSFREKPWFDRMSMFEPLAPIVFSLLKYIDEETLAGLAPKALTARGVVELDVSLDPGTLIRSLRILDDRAEGIYLDLLDVFCHPRPTETEGQPIPRAPSERLRRLAAWYELGPGRALSRRDRKVLSQLARLPLMYEQPPDLRNLDRARHVRFSLGYACGYVVTFYPDRSPRAFYIPRLLTTTGPMKLLFGPEGPPTTFIKCGDEPASEAAIRANEAFATEVRYLLQSDGNDLASESRVQANEWTL